MSRALVVMMVAAVLVGGEAKAQYATASVGVTAGSFDSSLQPYGLWLQHPRYGRIWQPSVAVVGSEFYPYGTGGQWVWTDAGWTFESNYPFAWATFHYGRWAYEPGYGWVWVPGYEWAPAWVSWRSGGSYVGWAPLGPLGAPEYSSSHWCYVERNSFTMADVYGRHLGGSRFHDAVAVTQPWERRGPSRDFVTSYGTPPPRSAYGSAYGAGPSRHREELRPSVMMGAPANPSWVAPPTPHERFQGEARRGFERMEDGHRGGNVERTDSRGRGFERMEDSRRGGGMERLETGRGRGGGFETGRTASPGFRAPPPSAPASRAGPSAPAFQGGSRGFGAGRHR